jgi:fibronectin type 3 domain-containing protein
MLKAIPSLSFLSTLFSTLCRKAALETAGRRWSLMKRSVLKVGLTAALCALAASSALGSFSVTNGPYWPGETDYYYGNTWISNSVMFNNSGSMIYNTATMPGDTGPIAPGVYRAGNFYWGMGVLDWGADGATINNNSGGTMQSIVSGTGEAQAIGVFSLQSVTINNSGLIDGEVTNNDGVASGVCQNSSGITVNNNVGATISAAAPYSATGIQCGGNVCIVNNGTITAVSYPGTEGITSNQAVANTIGTGGGSPIYVENNGTLSAICPSTTATNLAQVFTCWNNSTNTFKNTGLMYCENDSPVGNASDFYYGIQGYDESLFNSGMITNYSVSGKGWAAVWMENDADNGDYSIFNSGTIACNSSAMDVFFAGGFGPAGNNHICYTNTGTFNGGPLLLAFPATAWEAGQILTTSYGLSDGSQMHVTGLPTINPTINGGGTDSTLDFNLVGILQKINGTTASGTNFAGLGGSGSIVVSGKTYSWNNFANGVSGHVSAAGNVPPPWQLQDIGSVGVAGGAVYAGGLLTLLGSGSDIGSTDDKFHYVYQSMSNNCTIIAFVSSPQSTQTLAKAGLMIRDSLNTNAANAFIGVTPGSGVTWQVRSSDNASTTNSTTTGLSVWCESYWVKLAQNGTTLTGYYSVDGVNWTQLGSTTIASMGSVNFGGLAFCDHDNSSFGTATFASVICTGGLLVPSAPTGLTATAGMEQATLNWQAASNAADYNIGRSTINGGPYTTVASVTTTNYTDLNLAGRTTYYYVVTAVTAGCQGTNSAQVSATPTASVPAPWAAQDIGPLEVAGSESCTNNVFTVTASGSDYDASYTYTANPFDTFRFVYETNNSANFTNFARVVSLQGGNEWSKAGVTIRDSLNADAANVFIGMTPSNGVVFEHRSSDDVPGSFDDNVTNLVVPCWVELVQSGSTFTGYYSPDGVIWTQVGTATVSMGGTEYVGMAVCANDNGTGYFNNPATTTFTATFASVNVPPPVPTGLVATAAATIQINLVWNSFTNATSYNVKRSTTNGGPYAVVASGVTATNYSDSGLAGGTIYYYVVSAVVSGNESANSAQATATTLSPIVGSLARRYSFSETNGITIADSVGGPVWNGALPNGGTFSNGVLILSSGSSQYANLPAGIMNSLSNCTIMAWVNLSSTANWIRIFDFGNDTTTYMFLTPQNGANGTLRFAMTTNSSGGEQQINCASTLNTGGWHQVAVTLNTNLGILYLDGVAVGTNTSMTLNPAILGVTTNNYLGKSQWADPYFNGLFDEFRIYNVGLSSAEIAATAALGSDSLLSTSSPPVSLTLTRTNLTVSWPLASAGFIVKSRTNLTLGGWMNVTSPAPQIVGGQWQVALPQSTDSSKFYRLVK